MRTEDYDYELPERLIARHPAARREDSRLLRVTRPDGRLAHHTFRELPDLLHPGDLLVLNNTRVFPARLLGRRLPDGGGIEALLLRQEGEKAWWAMVRPGKKIKLHDRLVFAPGRLEATVAAYGEPSSGERLLEFTWQGDWWRLLEEVGHTPLPPYILKARKHDEAGEAAVHAPSFAPEEAEDRDRYQTVYAGQERASVAAPTAGLHFSPPVLEALERKGIERVFVQLHVGPGTFQPIKTDEVEDHPMHEEFIRISVETARRINRARREGRRIVAIGTTSVRALETAALDEESLAQVFHPGPSPILLAPPDRTEEGMMSLFPDSETGDGPVRPLEGWTRLFVKPGFRFRATDVLLTNFHLPRSSLLLLVSAFSDTESIRNAYRTAVQEEYHFYSYGDCMLID
ncbi:MAG TPA: S-adenosylmethionine:tRNA ribosyltransferase-isomerase [Candidatus Sumerlaeota bacterium]|nr:S-adenosylmethionine:tRNA ribosyltransferase-isomerase [Candidatus Sumerlaeota bacterium]